MWMLTFQSDKLEFFGISCPAQECLAIFPERY